MAKTYQQYTEIELPADAAIPISLPDGRLNPASRGWSRQPVQRCNLRGYPLRKKRWNYWCAVTPQCLFSVTLSNVDYMGLAFAYLLDFKTSRMVEKTIIEPFGKGCALPETVTGTLEYTNPGMPFTIDDGGAEVQITLSAAEFGGKPLQARLHLQRPQGLESLNVMIPWSDTRYHFTSKQNCLPASGTVRWGDTEYTFDPARDFACLDYGRGIWKYRSFWNWSSFSARVEGEPVGVNLGAGWTDASGTTENSLLFNGRLERLAEDVIFEYDPAHFMQPWRLRTAFSDQVDLTFTPFFERVAKTDLWLLRSEVHQMIGTFHGTLKSRTGRIYPVSEAIGWAEEHHARW